MTDEKILMKKLDEMVLKGHGEELVYACSIAAGAAIGGYQKGERRRILAAAIIGAISLCAQTRLKRRSEKIEIAKTKAKKGPDKGSSFL